MGYIRDGRSQGTLFPVVLDDLVPADHVCRVIDAFVDKLAMKEFGSSAPRQPTPVGQAMTRVTC
jgi:transposase